MGLFSINNYDVVIGGKMLITRTPLRTSFFGGGTDLKSFWQHETGTVLSSSIDKFIYVVIKKSYDGLIHVKYFEEEVVEQIAEIRHDLVRETMRSSGIDIPVEIVIFSDIPAQGSGLGSSSSLTVGLLNGLFAFQGQQLSKATLAAKACEIEIEVLKKPIGKQDQYIASYGGFCTISFYPDEQVEVRPLTAEVEIINKLNEHLLLFHTGINRKAESILKDQNRNTHLKLESLKKMRDQVFEAVNILMEERITEFGLLMKDAWHLKKQLSDGISNNFISHLEAKAFQAGASGLKITGAGGGGFLLVFCAPQHQNSVRDALRELREYKFHFDKYGSVIIFNDEH